MKNLLKKIFFILLISFLGIFLISLLANWQVKRLKESLSRIELPRLEIPKNKVESLPEIEGEKEFISPEGKLKFRYPADWTEIETQSFKERLPEEAKEVLNPLFFAQKMKMEKLTFATLAVEELISQEEMTPEEIIREVEKYHQQTQEIKILKLEKKNGQIIFEGSQGGIFGYNLSLKGKFLLTEEKIYLVIFTVFGKDSLEIQKEIEQILESIELSD